MEQYELGDIYLADIRRIQEQRKENLLGAFLDELPPSSLLDAHGIEIKADPPMQRPRPYTKLAAFFRWLIYTLRL